VSSSPGMTTQITTSKAFVGVSVTGQDD